MTATTTTAEVFTRPFEPSVVTTDAPPVVDPLAVEPVVHPVAARVVKRVFDIALAIVGLVVLSPVLAVAAIGIKLTSPGPVLFRQQRTGRGGRPFTMYKLRTFPIEHQDIRFSIEHRDCPLPFGRLLRRTSIDELPQLVNVLRGDMAIVGPRPERVHFATRFGAEVPGYADRHRVRGGLTGLAQVSGMVGNTSIAQRAELDNRYIERWSLLQDAMILAKTLPAVLRKLRD